MAQFFIHRPVFAWVLALVTMLAGGLGLSTLPTAQYPEIAPTTVRISGSYPGASAEIVEASVTTVIEDGMTGLDGLQYMTASSSPSRASVTLTFDDSVNPDIAQVQVQNQLQLVSQQLPDVVQQNGVSVSRSTSSILMVVSLTSPDGRYTAHELSDFSARLVEDRILRTDGVGSIQSFAANYAMRIWLDPMRMAQFQVTPSDVTAAVAEQNTNVVVGTLGAAPATYGQQITIPVSAQSQLSTVEEFERILLRVATDGSAVFLGDVARIEIGQESYEFESRYNGYPSTGFAVNLATGANAVAVAEAVRGTMSQLEAALPDGVEVVYPFDTSPFVAESIHQVYVTLGEAVVLVFIVILIFLQSWRATIIPVLAIPVVLLGTFGVLAVAGYSINTLTMFAMVLAIGLLVDDAIVVVENVERVMHEDNLGPVEATEKSMREISSALVGIVLVLSAVFVPMAFMGGSTGVIYRQFSVTIITAMVLSLGVALILTPAMCASLLRPSHRKIAPARWFNTGMDKLTNGFGGSVGWLVRRPLRIVLMLGAVCYGVFILFQDLPGSFLPPEDQGVLMVMIETPTGSTIQQTRTLVEQVETYMLENESESVEAVFSVIGFGFSGMGQSYAMTFVRLRDYADREGLSLNDLTQRANGYFYMTNRAGTVYVLQPPAIPSLGVSSGFNMYLVDQSGQGQEALSAAVGQLMAQAQTDGRVTGVRGSSAPPQTALRLDIDQQRAAAYGLSLREINAMLAVIFSGANVNDFALGNDLRPVIVQGDPEARSQPDDISRWFARNSSGEMVSFGAFSSPSWQQQAQSLSRFDGTRALELSGSATPGLSSGDAMLAMEEMVAGLEGNFGVAWTGLSFQERLSGNQAPILFALSALVVFLSLAALYESWSVPIAVLMTVPIGILGAIAAAMYFGQSNDVYLKVGLLTTIGLASRNAILIVEFAQAQLHQGASLWDAAVTAARLRLRPILMTTFAFALGVLPLALATGAGAGAQNSIGIGVLGGIATSALFGIFVIPVFYVAVVGVARKVSRKGSNA
ncbi:efflux RND transporter permease subunit [Pararhodobacter zhoushanensis]|uniref:Efflux pump membrane transporter n=1 Tax=Pararhodobacter zhoushanensis TaxID=2479545 RepID=A0ABT3H511_9RHOB|nr:efflux RND transporter permease subunit [Pararhodobacter zhoushanensis]MCW1934881.1 efflux RND transporter permease subunit [Pararhodobacter zhoushanensis]